MVSATPYSFKASSLEMAMAVGMVGGACIPRTGVGRRSPQTTWLQLRASTGDQGSSRTSFNMGQFLLQILCMYYLIYLSKQMTGTFTITSILQRGWRIYWKSHCSRVRQSDPRSCGPHYTASPWCGEAQCSPLVLKVTYLVNSMEWEWR